ncbi:MAG: hypothetical protein H6865_04420 [Rhodospirillales bacterium]|nr:hypothetical protein [Alphaproteobacteria bacterium]MCB9986863.1 hypothetical protein [Rhodospirillales bacterium]USO08376.1 MAG: hypothetical protein H6866_03960 [Rhodospirillales bacterium]
MIKGAIFTVMTATVLTHGATSAFHKIQASALQVDAVYKAAGQILDVDMSDSAALASANAHLMDTGAALAPLADYAGGTSYQ